MPDINGRKSALRKHVRALRAAEDEPSRIFADGVILERLTVLEQYKDARLLLTYVSEGSEPDTLRLIEYALSQGKQVACPRCDKAAHTMSFRLISSLEELVPGAYGIREPSPQAPETQPEELENSVCIVPGLAFDCSGGRIGYGGGYYDRFLAGYRGVSIGLCRSASLSDSPLPQEDCDVAVDIVVSDR